MVKDATTWKAWLSVPTTLWVSLLVSSAVMHVMSLQVRASEVQGTVALSTSTVSQKAEGIEASAAALSLGDVSSELKDIHPSTPS
jgi:hypothetical protein